MSPKVWVFSISWNEATMMPFFLAHYSTFADKIIIFDEHSMDGTRQIIKTFPKAEVRDWPYKGLDDNRFMEAVNERYKEARGQADWVMWPDVDEILWHPDPLKMLAECTSDAVQATGYGMISKEGPPTHWGQIYEVVRHGLRQDNYDKCAIWRPETDITHQHGRHTYLKADGSVEWPRGPRSVCRAEQSGWKLLHYHYFGTEYTRMRNARNYTRAPDKKFAWNYAPEHNSNPQQNGSLAWVKAALKANQMIEVIPPSVLTVVPRVLPGAPKLVKLHLGCGGHLLDGWDNYDLHEVDLRKQLPFVAGSVSHIYASHVVEHVTHRQAWDFFEECYRVLSPGGIVRIAIPDFNQLWVNITPAYCQAVKQGGHGDGSERSSMKAMVFQHGHMAVWNQYLLAAVLEVIGFDVRFAELGKSEDPDLCHVEHHGQVVGEDVAQVETSIVEGVKR